MKSMLEELSLKGWSQRADFLDSSEVKRLRNQWEKHRRTAHPATISSERKLAPQIRGDSILWLEDAGVTDGDPLLVKLQELLRQANETLFLPLREIEAHFAHYPPGAGYDAHYDQGKNRHARLLSAVIYLNEAWTPADGGELILWHDESKSKETARIPPQSGRLVLFRSDTIYHEVAKSHSSRLSIAAWFRKG